MNRKQQRGKKLTQTVKRLLAVSVHTDLDGFHRVVLVQLVDVVGDAGVEWRRGDRVDDGGFVRLLLVALAV